MKKNRVRNFMGTINFDNKITDPYKVLPDFSKFKYLKSAMGQLEIGEKSKLKHWQIFFEFSEGINPYDYSGLGVHWDTKYSGKKHPAAGRNYVRKATPYINTRFKWPSDIDNIQDKISYWDLCTEHDNAEKEYCKDKSKESIIRLIKANIKLCEHYQKV